MRIEHDVLDIAGKTPGKPAIESDGHTLSFEDLERQSAAWAVWLIRAGLGAGHPVWIALANSPEFIVAALATLRAGGVVVPIDPRLTAHELAQLVQTCFPAAIFCEVDGCAALDEAFADRMPPMLIAATCGLEPAIVGESEQVSTEGIARLSADGGTPGVVYFTSGSTGRPKGILLCHDNIAANAAATARAFGLTAEDRSLVCMRMCHSYTFTKQVLAHLGVGATLVLAPHFFVPAVVLDLAQRCCATTLYAVPSMHAMLQEQLRRQSLDLPSLRLLVTGGAPMPQRVQEGLCDCLPGAAFISSYGLSEAGPCVTALPPQWTSVKPGSVGLPIRDVQVVILDESGAAVPSGTVGELCVRGPGVMAGYLNDAEATARMLRGGWLHTGDLGWQDLDGCVFLCGRQDDLILRGGENVYPVEVEEVLCRHPDVLEAAVIGVPHPILGEEIVAFVRTIEEGTGSDPLRRHCLEYLSVHKVPRSIHIVQSLPHTANGKLNRRRLREQNAQRSMHLPAVERE